MAEFTLSLHEKQLSHFKRYRAFGLKIASELTLNELQPGVFDHADVTIRFGETPGKLTNQLGKGVLYQAGKDEFLFRLNTVGAFYIHGGSAITVERLNNAKDSELSLFLLGSVFGALFHQRKMLAFHGSTVEVNGEAIPVLGSSGAGKSSIAAVFLRKGHRILADDISVIEHSDNALLAIPGIPHLKLWKDIADRVELDLSGLERVRPQLQKYRQPAGDRFADRPYPVKLIVILATKNTPGFEVRRLKGAEVFNGLKNHSFRYRFMHEPDQLRAHFTQVNKVARSIPVFRITRPSSPVLLEELFDQILTLSTA